MVGGGIAKVRLKTIGAKGHCHYCSFQRFGFRSKKKTSVKLGEFHKDTLKPSAFWNLPRFVYKDRKEGTCQ